MKLEVRGHKLYIPGYHPRFSDKNYYEVIIYPTDVDLEERPRDGGRRVVLTSRLREAEIWDIHAHNRAHDRITSANNEGATEEANNQPDYEILGRTITDMRRELGDPTESP